MRRTALRSMRTATGESLCAATKIQEVKVAQLCLTPWTIIVHGILQARILKWVAIPFSRRSSQTRDQTQVSHIARGFFTIEPPGKPKNTGVGSLSLLQGIFPTRELNQGLLHSRQIFYQLCYQGSPKDKERTKQLPLKDGLKIQHSFLQRREQADRENSGGNPPNSEGYAQMEHGSICQA